VDDPLTILREAGIECPEVEAWGKCRAATAELFGWSIEHMKLDVRSGGPAVLVLANLAAKQAWMLRYVIERVALTPERWNGWTTSEVLADIAARWETRDE